MPNLILGLATVGCAVASVNVFFHVPQAYLLYALLDKIFLSEPFCECQQVLRTMGSSCNGFRLLMSNRSR